MERRVGTYGRIVGCAALLLLAACGKSEREEFADRVEPEIAAAHTTDPVERRQVAEAIADDAISLQQDAAAVAEPSAEALAAQDARAADVMTRECAQMRLELDMLRRPSTEIRTPEEIAGVPAEIQKLEARLADSCTGR